MTKIQTTKESACTLANLLREKGWMTVLYKERHQAPGIVTLETTCYGEHLEEILQQPH